MGFPEPPMPKREEPVEVRPAEEFSSVSSSILRRMGYIERLQRKMFGEIFSAYGLHPSQGMALKVIIRNPGMSQRELADRLRIQRATITVILQKLERGDFIHRQPDPFDQRIIRIFPTPKGETASRLTDETCEAFFRCCFEGIPDAQQEDLQALLGKMEDNIFDFERSLHEAKEPRP